MAVGCPPPGTSVVCRLPRTAPVSQASPKNPEMLSLGSPLPLTLLSGSKRHGAFAWDVARRQSPGCQPACAARAQLLRRGGGEALMRPAAETSCARHRRSSCPGSAVQRFLRVSIELAKPLATRRAA